jgi:hypothetical protein
LLDRLFLGFTQRNLAADLVKCGRRSRGRDVNGEEGQARLILHRHSPGLNPPELLWTVPEQLSREDRGFYLGGPYIRQINADPVSGVLGAVIDVKIEKGHGNLCNLRERRRPQPPDCLLPTLTKSRVTDP